MLEALFPKSNGEEKPEKPTKPARAPKVKADKDVADDMGYVEPKAEGFAAARMPKDISAPNIVTPKQVAPAQNAQQRFALGDGSAGDFALPAPEMLQTPPPELKEMQLDEAALRKNAELLQNLSLIHI